jgi:hypothetical protein
LRVENEELKTGENNSQLTTLNSQLFTDYTKWREGLFSDVSAEEFLHSAANFRKESQIKAGEGES